LRLLFEKRATDGAEGRLKLRDVAKKSCEDIGGCGCRGVGVDVDGLPWAVGTKHTASSKVARQVEGQGILGVCGVSRGIWGFTPATVGIIRGNKDWVVHSLHYGQGESVVLNYLARYVFRIAITNHRIIGMDQT
jgi:hypothetical protein